jgi:UDP-GlcNAc3NAcA epimerase
MMKLLTIVGARPQFVKAATVSRVLRDRPGMTEVLVHTGQHYDANMSDVFFRELDIPTPAHHLGIGSGPHGAQTGRMLEAIERVMQAERPDWVLVYGDTNSTLAGALAAAKLHLPVAHVEAGLRSSNRAMPEEINRVMTDHASDLLLAPTAVAVGHLRREGIDASRVRLTGDVMYDASLYFRDRAADAGATRQRFGVADGAYVLATIHRAENTDDPRRLQTIVRGLAAASRQIPVLWPMHPRTRHALGQLAAELPASVRLVDPVGYLDMVTLEAGARAIVTDSGGVQKEAFFFKVPCITLRHETEWTELVACGWNTLLPPLDTGSVADGILRVVSQGAQAVWPEHLYGTGRAAHEVVRCIEEVSGAQGR